MRFFSLCMLIMLLSPIAASPKCLGIAGKTYRFAEKDGLSEVEERARQVDWKKEMSGLRASAKAATTVQLSIPRAAENRARAVDMTYTLQEDMPNPQNPSLVLYPKGFSFNPLQYMTMPGCVVFVDVADKAQREWLKTSRYGKDSTATILLTGGDLGQMERTLGRPLFYADRILVDEFDIAVVPSIACQKGVSLEVQEIKVRPRP